MKLVIDSTIVFASLISRKTFYLEFLNQNEIYAPDFLFEEISHYESKIIKKSSLKEDFYDYAQELFKHINVIPRIAVRIEAWEKAYRLCCDIDVKDTSFLALALELNLPLITGDKKLQKGLLKKGFKNIILFEDIFDRIKPS